MEDAVTLAIGGDAAIIKAAAIGHRHVLGEEFLVGASADHEVLMASSYGLCQCWWCDYYLVTAAERMKQR